MRLLDVGTLEVGEFFEDDIPEYAALSHTWGSEEASLQQWTRHPNPAESTKRGFLKVLSVCRLAQREGFQYLWVDTVCIDKTSSEHVTEAINSMFQWYREAKVCYAYLEDVEHQPKARQIDQLRTCRWFTRGWTVQELLAPKTVKFYDHNWSMIGTKIALVKDIADITSIDEKVLLDSSEVTRQSIAQRMSWFARRKTTRKEDIAYCMMGIFDVNMLAMYGEGNKAFIRLQEGIINTVNDHTIFCWTWPEDTPRPAWLPVLAPSPAAFRHSRAYIPDRKRQRENMYGYSVTNNLAIQMPLQIAVSSGVSCFALLDVRRSDNPSEHAVAIPLVRLAPRPSWSTRPEPVWRAEYPASPVLLPPSWESAPRDLSLARPGLEPIGSDLEHGGSFTAHEGWPKQRVSPFAAIVLQRVGPNGGEQIARLARASQSCGPLLFLKPTRSPRVWYQSVEVSKRNGAYLVNLAVWLRPGGASWHAGLDPIEPDAPVSVIERQVAGWGSKVEFRVPGEGIDGIACFEFAEDGMELVLDELVSVDDLVVRPASFNVYLPQRRALAT